MKTLILAALFAMTVGAHAAPVTTVEGPVEGVAKNGVTRFLGIPYASPPVGAWRWMPLRCLSDWAVPRVS